VCHPDLRVEGEGCVPMVEYFAKVDIQLLSIEVYAYFIFLLIWFFLFFIFYFYLFTYFWRYWTLNSLLLKTLHCIPML
jgi:hypothetical protein